jgi:hypothetical protein
MGQLSENAAERGEVLTGYFIAALHYIDPALTAESSMDEVIGAAARKQRYLRQHAAASTPLELSQLSEAVLFVQRVRRNLGS